MIIKNPCTGAKAPDGVQGTHRPLEQWERDLVHQTAKTHRFGRAAMLMLYGGLRKGEALAFDIDRDADFESGRIYVREAVSYSDDHRGRLDGTKTDSGVRDLPMFAPLRECLLGHHGLAAPMEGGKIMTSSAFGRAWKSYINDLTVIHNGGRVKRWYGKTREDKETIARGEELPPYMPVTIRTHDFRHSFCTMICTAGVDIKTAMKWMGHADEKMIRRIYDHVLKDREREQEKKTAALVDTMINTGQGVKTGVKFKNHTYRLRK